MRAVRGKPGDPGHPSTCSAHGDKDHCSNCKPDPGLVIKFNPFAFDIETNNEFIRRGYEPIIQTDVL